MSTKAVKGSSTYASQYGSRSLLRCQSIWGRHTLKPLFIKVQSDPCASLRYYNTPSNNSLFGINAQNSNVPPSYFQRSSLPTNTIIRFVPQQTAWIVERMGKFNRILPPGFAILYPVLERIAYVKSLKETALEIPSQSAITADNVTLELDGVLYTRVFDAYKARWVLGVNSHECPQYSNLQLVMGLKTQNMLLLSLLKQP